jgi:hypothetical protein
MRGEEAVSPLANVGPEAQSAGTRLEAGAMGLCPAMGFFMAGLVLTVKFKA